jgi:hypothetical protein
VIALVSAAFLLLTAYVPKRPFVGNYVARRGVLGDDIILPGVRPLVIPNWAFDVLVVVATLAALVLVLALIPWITESIDAVRERRFVMPDPALLLVGMTFTGFAVGYVLAMAGGMPIFDRYALGALPLGALLLLRSSAYRRARDPLEVHSRSRDVRAGAVVTLLAMVALGLAYSAESASFDGTRWAVAQKAVDAGFSTIQVDGGYEWVGWFRGDGPLTSDSEQVRKKLRAGYYEGLCVSVLVDADPDRPPPNVIAKLWSHAPTRSASLFVAYRNERACAPPAERNGP